MKLNEAVDDSICRVPNGGMITRFEMKVTTLNLPAFPAAYLSFRVIPGDWVRSSFYARVPPPLLITEQTTGLVPRYLTSRDISW